MVSVRTYSSMYLTLNQVLDNIRAEEYMVQMYRSVHEHWMVSILAQESYASLLAAAIQRMWLIVN